MQAITRIILCLVLSVTGAVAQSYPSRTVKIIVPTGPGSATDIMARLLADGMSQTLGQTVVVENMSGASGILAHQSVARAEPDGYTLLITNTSGMAINLVSFKQLPYDPRSDFVAVGMVCSLGPQMLSVNSELPAKSVSELIAYAKQSPGKLSIAFDTTAGAGVFAAKMFNRRAGLDLAEVPYRSAAQMAQDTASGINQILMSSIAAAKPVMDSSKVRMLGVTSEQRFPGLPELPTISETLPGVIVNGWFAIVAPARTPVDITRLLNQSMAAFLASPDIQRRLLLFGLATEGAGTPQSTADFITQQQVKWISMAKELNLQPE